MEKITFKASDENGNEIEYEVISLFDSDDKNKNFIFYTDNKLINGENRLFVSLYNKIGDDIEIIPIKEKEDWDFITEHLKNKKEGA